MTSALSNVFISSPKTISRPGSAWRRKRETAAPVLDHEPAPEHSAEVREVRHARLGADELAKRGRDHAGEVVSEKIACAEQPLDVAPEHVQREHVEENVRGPAVQKAVGEELPDPEAVPDRPKREPRLQQVAGH